MIVALSLSALVGTWTCSSPDQPRARFVYTFTRKGTGSLAQVAPPALRATIRRFTYQISDRGIFEQSPLTLPILADIRVQQGVLKEKGYMYQHEGEWLTPSNWNRYTCKRASPSK